MPVVTHTSRDDSVYVNKDNEVDNKEDLITTNHSTWPGPSLTIHVSNFHPGFLPGRYVLRTSFGDLQDDKPLIPYEFGLVHGIIRALQQGISLTLRPDDIWLAILSQLALFQRGNNDTAPGLFLSQDVDGHEIVNIDLARHSPRKTPKEHYDFALCEEFGSRIRNPGQKEWLLPSFSTSTTEDKLVAGLVIASSVYRYSKFAPRGFSGFGLQPGGNRGGFKAVKLLGGLHDWQELLSKVKYLQIYHADCRPWSILLQTVVANIIGTFHDPASQQVKDFWNGAAAITCTNGGRTKEYLSGWITAFLYWDKRGFRTKNIAEDWDCEIRVGSRSGAMGFPVVTTKDLPSGVVAVPINIKSWKTRTGHDVTLIGGAFGMEITDKLTIVQPRSGWVMFEEQWVRFNDEEELHERNGPDLN